MKVIKFGELVYVNNCVGCYGLYVQFGGINLDFCEFDLESFEDDEWFVECLCFGLVKGMFVFGGIFEG